MKYLDKLTVRQRCNINGSTVNCINKNTGRSFNGKTVTKLTTIKYLEHGGTRPHITESRFVQDYRELSRKYIVMSDGKTGTELDCIAMSHRVALG